MVMPIAKDETTYFCESTGLSKRKLKALTYQAHMRNKANSKANFEDKLARLEQKAFKPLAGRIERTYKGEGMVTAQVGGLTPLASIDTALTPSKILQLTDKAEAKRLSDYIHSTQLEIELLSRK